MNICFQRVEVNSFHSDMPFPLSRIFFPGGEKYPINTMQQIYVESPGIHTYVFALLTYATLYRIN